MLQGSLVALITPMTVALEVDESALRRLVDWHVDSGTHGLVAAGTTGESPVLSGDEHRLVLRVVVEQAAGRIPVVAGCGSNNTREAQMLHQFAADVGADAALHVTGYYNRPSQEGIFRHFEALAQGCDLPILIYNIPARTVVDIAVETVARIATLPSVIGIKDSTGDLSRPCFERLAIDKPFVFLSGEDATAVAYNAAGGQGCISVAANVFPDLCAQMHAACSAGDFPTAMAIQQRLMPLYQALVNEPSPAGVKYACAQLGLSEPVARLPMVPLADCSRAAIDSALAGLAQNLRRCDLT